jgi:heat shock protein HtpX
MRYAGHKSGGRSSSRKRDGGGLVAVLFVLWLLAIILAPLVTRLLAMAVSRQREYLADASAAELTRNPLALARALKKLESSSAPTQSIKKSSAHLCIVDPLGRTMNLKEGFLADLFATHPPLTRRITLLNAMAYKYDQISSAS